jgi:hypothetical protein
MALIACKDCNAEISTDAKACPKCGAQNAAAYKAVRISGLIYLGLAGLLFYWIWGVLTPEPKTQTTIAYSITKDEQRPNAPRKVEVMLERRLTDTELAEVAAAVRDEAKEAAERTFIGFRVAGQTESAYWANASFEPDYSANVIGLSADGYQKLSSLDLSVYPELVGHWLRDGALGHAMVLYKNNGEYFIDSYFADGSKGTEAYTAKPLADGELRLEQPNDFGEYYVLKKDGTLQGWSENGMYLALSPSKV